MKYLISICALTFSFTSCGGKDDKNTSSSNNRPDLNPPIYVPPSPAPKKHKTYEERLNTEMQKYIQQISSDKAEFDKNLNFLNQRLTECTRYNRECAEANQLSEKFNEYMNRPASTSIGYWLDPISLSIIEITANNFKYCGTNSLYNSNYTIQFNEKNITLQNTKNAITFTPEYKETLDQLSYSYDKYGINNPKIIKYTRVHKEYFNLIKEKLKCD